MREIPCLQLTVTLLLVGLANVVFIPVAIAQSTDVAVVVHTANPVNNLTIADLRRIFVGGKHSWPGGNPIKLFLRSSGSHEHLVLLKLVGMSEAEYKRYWAAQVFRGEIDHEPLSLASVGMALEATRAFPGAIALIDARDLKPGPFIKVVRIEGRLPGESGYPLN